MTERELYLLLETTAIDIPPQLTSALPLPLCEALSRAASHDENHILRRCTLSPEIRALTLNRYVNDNPSPMSNTGTLLKSGFVGSVLTSPAKDAWFLFRGSESLTFADVLTDWRSNFTASLGATITQQKMADALFRREAPRYPGRKLLMGHSKGGNLAAHAYVNNPDAQPKAFIVNGQPIYWQELTATQKAAMRSADMRFIVQEGDVVAALGYVDYINRIVALKPGIKPGIVASHRLQNAAFDATGRLITLYEGMPGSRQAVSWLFYGLIRLLKSSGLTADVVAAEQLIILVSSVVNVIYQMAAQNKTRARLAAGRCLQYLSETGLPEEGRLCAAELLEQIIRECEKEGAFSLAKGLP